MPYYKLKVGSHTDGAGVTQRFYHAKDPLRNIVESEINLATMDSAKFEKYDGVVPEGSLALTTPGKTTRTSAAASPAKARVAPPEEAKAPEEAKTKDAHSLLDDAGNEDLETMTVHDLKQMAADEEIDLGGATLKADIVKTIRKVRGKG